VEHHLVREYSQMIIRILRDIVLVERQHLKSVRQRGLQDELGEGEISFCVYRLTRRMSASIGSRAFKNCMGVLPLEARVLSTLCGCECSAPVGGGRLISRSSSILGCALLI